MLHIIVTKTDETTDAWVFKVIVEENDSRTQHGVTLDKTYWNKLTNEGVPPEKLIEKSFHFLLEREPKESILRRFNLRDIAKYFGEYENEVGNQ